MRHLPSSSPVNEVATLLNKTSLPLVGISPTGRPEPDPAFTKVVVDYAHAVRTLEYPKFRALVGILTKLRSGDVPAPGKLTRFFKGVDPLKELLSAGLGAVHRELTAIHRLHNQGIQNLATDAQLVARRACGVGGINVVRPENHHETVRAANTVRISSGPGTDALVIAPGEDPKAVTMVRFEKQNVPFILRPNEMLIAGRLLSTNSALGIPLDLGAGIPKGPISSIANEWSRAAIGIAKLGTGDIIVFDRGSFFPLRVSIENAQGESMSSLVYQPRVKVEGGRTSFGETVYT